MTTISGNFTVEGFSSKINVGVEPQIIDYSITGPYAGTVVMQREPTPGGGNWENSSTHGPSLLTVKGRSATRSNDRIRMKFYPCQQIVNGAFAADTNWTKGTGWTIAGGVAVATGAISTALSQATLDNLVAGASYSVKYDVTARSAGSVAVSLGGGTAGTARSTVATFTETIVAGSSNQLMAFTGSGFTGSIDNVSFTPVTAYSFNDQDLVVREFKDFDGKVLLTQKQSGQVVAGNEEVVGNLIVDGNLTVNGSVTGAQILAPAQYGALNATTGTLGVGAITGAAFVVLNSTNATPGTQTTRTASQMFNDTPGAQIGMSYLLRIINQGAGTFTLGQGSGTTLTGTMTVLVNTQRDFIVTFTSATALVIQSLGTVAVTAV